MGSMHELKDSPRLSDYKEREHLLNQVAFLLHSHFTQGGNTKWEHRDKVRAELEALVNKWWPKYKRTPKEQKELERAINSW